MIPDLKRINSSFIPLGVCLPSHLSVVYFIFNPVQFQIMRAISKHLNAFGKAFTFVFLLACSGFTTILHICAMHACECCDTSGASDLNVCPDEQLPLPVAGLSFHGIDDCHINAVVGGIGVVQALVENESKPQNVEVLSLPTSTFVSSARVCTSSWFNYSYSERVSPPSVEKYVLNATFLI